MFVFCCLASTLQELIKQTGEARQRLTQTDFARVTSVSSGCELFLRFITMTSQLHTVVSAESKAGVLDE